jgi:hypothetical protein
LSVQRVHIAKIRVGNQRVLDDGIHSFRHGDEGILIPAAFFEHLPVFTLELLVHPNQPYFTAKGVVLENDGDFQVALFEGGRRKGELGDFHVIGRNAAGYGIVRIFLLEMRPKAHEGFHQASIGRLDRSFFELSFEFLEMFVKGGHVSLA